MKYEYKVIPAPSKAAKVKGVKGTEAKFAVALSDLMNELGAEGWEYQRTDTLPCEERQGLTGRVTTFQNMLVFRRVLGAEQSETGNTAPAAIERSEPVLAVPTFRSTARSSPRVTNDAPEETPHLDAPSHPEPSDQAPRIEATAER